MKALIAGLGAVGQRHARNLRALRPDIELIAWRQRWRPGVISDRLEFSTGDAEQALGIKSFADLDSALATRPDIAVICNPSNLHAQTALRSAAAGCHLFIETPVASTLDGLARLSTMADERRLVAAVGSQWRFHPLVERVKTLLAGGMIGKVRRAEIEFSEYLPDWHPYEDYRASYAARSEQGGGVVLAQIHDYDLAWWLFGAARSVMAMGGTQGTLGIDVEDTMQAQLDCAAGTVTVRQTFAEQRRARRIEVQGEKGTLTCDLLRSSVESTVPDVDGVELKEYDHNSAYLGAMSDLLGAVEGGRSPRTPLGDGIEVLKLALAVKESARRRMPMGVS
jgi:predicted dehydrogenase